MGVGDQTILFFVACPWSKPSLHSSSILNKQREIIFYMSGEPLKQVPWSKDMRPLFPLFFLIIVNILMVPWPLNWKFRFRNLVIIVYAINPSTAVISGRTLSELKTFFSKNNCNSLIVPDAVCCIEGEKKGTPESHRSAWFCFLYLKSTCKVKTKLTACQHTSSMTLWSL